MVCLCCPQVFFYIDPEFATDPKMNGINIITLRWAAAPVSRAQLRCSSKQQALGLGNVLCVEARAGPRLAPVDASHVGAPAPHSHPSIPGLTHPQLHLLQGGRRGV